MSAMKSSNSHTPNQAISSQPENIQSSQKTIDKNAPIDKNGMQARQSQN